MSRLSRTQLAHATTTSPYTRDFRHLLSFPRYWLERLSFRVPKIKAVRTSDRIKYWNIVPGDQVRVLGDRRKQVQEVLSINRISNRVYLKGIVEEGDEETKQAKQSKSVHYSRCQLFLGQRESLSTSTAPDTQPQSFPVFAARLGTSKPFWNYSARAWDWNRYAVATIPRLSESEREERIRIPWPVPEDPPIPRATLYDTPADVVGTITYVPPPLPAGLSLPKSVSEHEYIKSITPGANGVSTAFDPRQPMEVHLHKELSNPHSRAKKQARWQAAQEHKRILLAQYVREELKDLKGRTRAVARSEAEWKWRFRLEADRKAELKRRWKNRGMEARLVRKKASRARKEEKQSQRLQTMTLKDGPNQIVPKS